jgi:nucleotide-binding universal stress UspA family protein
MAEPDPRPVLVAYDGSTASREVVREAVHLLGHRFMLIVTVWEPGLAAMTAAPTPDAFGMRPLPPDAETVMEVDAAMRNHAESVAAEGAELARSLGAAAEPLPVADELDVADTVVQLAEKHDAQAVVVGSRGLSGIRSRFLGSTSRRVLDHCARPVLVIRGEHGAPHHE